MVEATQQTNALLLVYVRKHFFFFLVREGEHYLFFDSAPSTPKPDLAEKYPSIIVRQTESTLRAFSVLG